MDYSYTKVSFIRVLLSSWNADLADILKLISKFPTKPLYVGFVSQRERFC